MKYNFGSNFLGQAKLIFYRPIVLKITRRREVIIHYSIPPTKFIEKIGNQWYILYVVCVVTLLFLCSLLVYVCIILCYFVHAGSIVT